MEYLTETVIKTDDKEEITKKVTEIVEKILLNKAEKEDE